MSQSNRKVYVAVVVACLAVGLSIHTAVRGPSGAKASGGACIDQDAREQIVLLRRALAERDALVGRLARAANVAGEGSNAVESPAPPQTRPETPSEPGRRRYARFETPNPAVTVTQNADGSYDIRTTDPALAGSTMEITAVTPSGAEDKVFIRIPP